MLAIQNLQPGAKLRLKKDNAVAEVVDNPGDERFRMHRVMIAAIGMVCSLLVAAAAPRRKPIPITR